MTGAIVAGTIANQSYIGVDPRTIPGAGLHVAKLREVKNCLFLLPRRQMVERASVR